MIYRNDDFCINNLIFRFKDGTFKQLGPESEKGRTETFKLAEGETLAGAVIEHGSYYVMALTFLTVRKE